MDDAPITLEQLANIATPWRNHQVEIMGLEGGWYIVYLHQPGGAAQLVDQHGNSLRFSGTQWVSRALRPYGFTHAMLTWEELGDEMIGVTSSRIDPVVRRDNGVRVALETD